MKGRIPARTHIITKSLLVAIMILSACSWKLEPLHRESVDVEKQSRLRDELLVLQNKDGLQPAIINNNWIRLASFEQQNAIKIHYDCFARRVSGPVNVSGSGTRFVGPTDQGLAIISIEGREEWSKPLPGNITSA